MRMWEHALLLRWTYSKQVQVATRYHVESEGRTSARMMQNPWHFSLNKAEVVGVHVLEGEFHVRVSEGDKMPKQERLAPHVRVDHD